MKTEYIEHLEWYCQFLFQYKCFIQVVNILLYIYPVYEYLIMDRVKGENIVTINGLPSIILITIFQGSFDFDIVPILLTPWKKV